MACHFVSKKKKKKHGLPSQSQSELRGGLVTESLSFSSNTFFVLHVFTPLFGFLLGLGPRNELNGWEKKLAIILRYLIAYHADERLQLK